MQQQLNNYDYVLYVDEAGDDGLRAFRPEDENGCSEWLCIGGYLVRAEVDVTLSSFLQSIRKHIGATQSRTLHYKDLSFSKRMAVCSALPDGKARAFSVCSYKRTLSGHSNSRAAAAHGGNSQWLYNFLIRLLLERVTDFCWRDSLSKGAERPQPIKIVFSHRGGHRYGQMKAYFELLKLQAVANTTFLDRRVIRPEMLRFSLVDYLPHYQMAGLQLADIVSSAFYQGLNTHSKNWSCEPAQALARIVAKEELGGTMGKTFADYGVTLVPKPYRVNLDERQRRLFTAFGYRFEQDGHWR
jgi:Protein of unknown function (DUF3800)